MDGLSRKETSYHTVRVQRSETEAYKTDLIPIQQSPDPFFPQDSTTNIQTGATKERMIGAYVVSNKMVLRNWADARYAVVILPSGTDYWRDKDMRVLADQLAFQSHAVVVVPDLYRGQTYASDDTTDTIDDAENTINMYRGEIFPTRDEWIRHQDSKRVFDDIVATLAYVRAKHNVQSVALLGVGEGGGVALEAVCDLSDLARLGMYNSIEDQLLHCGAIPALARNSDAIPFEAVSDAITAGLATRKGPAFDILQSVVKANLHAFTRRPQSLCMRDRIHAEHEEYERTRLQRELDLASEEMDLEAAMEAAAKDLENDNSNNNSNNTSSSEENLSTDGALESQLRSDPSSTVMQSTDSWAQPQEKVVFKKLDESYDFAASKFMTNHDQETGSNKENCVTLESLAGKPPSEADIEEVLRRVQLSQLMQSAQGAPAPAQIAPKPTSNIQAGDAPALAPQSVGKTIPLRLAETTRENSPAEAEAAAKKATEDAVIQGIEDATSFDDDEEALNAEIDAADPGHVAARARLKGELDLELLQSEWVQIFQAAKRAENRQLLAPFASYSAADFANFVPRSVVAVSPQG